VEFAWGRTKFREHLVHLHQLRWPEQPRPRMLHEDWPHCRAGQGAGRHGEKGKGRRASLRQAPRTCGLEIRLEISLRDGAAGQAAAEERPHRGWRGGYAS